MGGLFRKDREPEATDISGETSDSLSVDKAGPVAPKMVHGVQEVARSCPRSATIAAPYVRPAPTHVAVQKAPVVRASTPSALLFSHLAAVLTAWGGVRVVAAR